MELIRGPNRILELVYALCFGQYGIAVMTSSLTNLPIQFFYRLCTERRIGSICRPSFFLWTSGLLWIPDVLVWWWSFGLSSTRVDGVTLIEYKMHRGYLYFLFRWLIHVATLCDPWCVNFILKNLMDASRLAPLPSVSCWMLIGPCFLRLVRHNVPAWLPNPVCSIMYIAATCLNAVLVFLDDRDLLNLRLAPRLAPSHTLIKCMLFRVLYFSSSDSHQAPYWSQSMISSFL